MASRTSTTVSPSSSTPVAPTQKMLLARRLPMPAKRPVTEAGIDRTSQLRAQRAKRRRREHLDEAMHAR
eukprot:559037-Pyramimonas_sp.AAC.1